MESIGVNYFLYPAKARSVIMFFIMGSSKLFIMIFTNMLVHLEAQDVRRKYDI